MDYQKLIFKMYTQRLDDILDLTNHHVTIMEGLNSLMKSLKYSNTYNVQANLKKLVADIIKLNAKTDAMKDEAVKDIENYVNSHHPTPQEMLKMGGFDDV